MGEIVRVLKWRLDLDSAGMADGIEKAATSAEKLATSAAKIGDTGTAGLKKTTAAAKETETAFEGLGFEAKQVEMYVSRLEKGSGSPLVLKRNAELAEAAFNVLAASAQKVGQVVPEAFSGRVVAAIEQATTQAAGMNAELEKMGGQTPTKLDKVITALEKTEASAADAWEAIRKMGDEGARAAAALEKMQAASDSPRELQRTAALAELEMNQLREAIDRARASGVQLGPDLGSSLNKATTSIAAANTRAGQMRDTLGDMKTRGDLAAKGFEATAGAAGSLEGMLSRLNDTGGKSSQAIADMGFKIVALSAAARLGYTEGEKLRAVLVDLGVPLPDISNRLGDVIVNIGKFAQGSNDSKSATDALSGSLVDMVVKLGLLGAGYGRLESVEDAAIARARIYLALRESQAASERALASAQAASGLRWESASAAQEKWLAQLAAAELALSRAGTNNETYNKTLALNEKTIRDLAAGEDTFNTALTAVAPRVAAALAELDRLAGAHDKGAGAAARHAVAEDSVKYSQREGVKITQDTAEAILEKAAAYEGSAKAADDAANAQRDHTTAVQEAESAEQDFGTSLDYVAQKVVEHGGTLTAGAPIFLTVVQASDEATASLLRQAEAWGVLNEKQTEALSVTKGWTDYVIGLQDSFEAGTTSLYNYTTELIRFKTQLQQMYGAAKGEAKEALESMIALIQELIATAGAGGSNKYDPSMAGQLERMFGQGKG